MSADAARFPPEPYAQPMTVAEMRAALDGKPGDHELWFRHPALPYLIPIGRLVAIPPP
jgi:hypothetical protein